MATRIIIDNRIKTYFQNDDFTKIIEKCYESNIGKNKDKKLNLKFTETYIETLYMHLNLYMNINKNQDINNKNLKEVFDNICVSVLIYSFFKGEYNSGLLHNYKIDIYIAIKKLLNQLNKNKFKDLIEVFNKIEIKQDNNTLGDIKNIDDGFDFNNISDLIEYINSKTQIKKGGTIEKLPSPLIQDRTVIKDRADTEKATDRADAEKATDRAATDRATADGATADGATADGAAAEKAAADGAAADGAAAEKAAADGATDRAETTKTADRAATEKAKEDDNKTLLNVFKMKIMYEIFLFKEDEIEKLIDVIIKEKS